jgi:hypothetical protein
MGGGEGSGLLWGGQGAAAEPEDPHGPAVRELKGVSLCEKDESLGSELERLCNGLPETLKVSIIRRPQEVRPVWNRSVSILDVPVSLPGDQLLKSVIEWWRGPGALCEGLRVDQASDSLRLGGVHRLDETGAESGRFNPLEIPKLQGVGTVCLVICRRKGDLLGGRWGGGLR